MKLKVIRQGAPIINVKNVHIAKEGDGFLAVEVDMKSKWCIVDSTFSSPPNSFGFSISTTERSLYLKKGIDPEDWTEVEIKGCVGWEIFSVDCSRYTVRLVMIKRDSEV